LEKDIEFEITFFSPFLLIENDLEKILSQLFELINVFCKRRHVDFKLRFYID